MVKKDSILNRAKGIFFKGKAKDGSGKDAFNSYLDELHSLGMCRTGEFQQLYYDAVRNMYGDQLPAKCKRYEKWDYVAINRIYPSVMQEISVSVANNPQFNTTAVEDSDIDDAEMMGKILKAKWVIDLQGQMRSWQALLDGHLNGYYGAYFWWNPKKQWDKRQQQWVGDVEMEIFNPANFGCDPNVELCTDMATKAEFVCLNFWVPKKWAVHQYPELDKYLKETDENWDKNDPNTISANAGGGIGSSGIDESNFNRSTGDWSGRRGTEVQSDFARRMASLIAGAGKIGVGTSNSDMDDNNIRMEIFLWRDYSEETVPAIMADYTPDEIRSGMAEGQGLGWSKQQSKYINLNRPVDDETGNPLDFMPWDSGTPLPQKELKPEYKRPKYPNGRYTLRFGKDFIAEDRPYPYRQWTIAIGVNNLLPHMWQGANSVEIGLPLQKYLNNIHTHFLNNLKFHGNTQYKAEQGALVPRPGETEASIPNHPGSVITCAPGALDKVQAVPPPPLPNWMFNLEEMVKQYQQDISGVQDVGMGRQLKGQATLGEAQILDSNTKVRMTLQIAAFYSFLTQCGYIIADLIQNHYTADRWVRIIGDSQEAKVSTMKWTTGLADAKFDIQIEPTSTMPYDEADTLARYNRATELIGPAMFRSMLKKLKIENVDEILRNHEILGPFTQLLETASQVGFPPEKLIPAILQVTQQINIMEEGQNNGNQKQEKGQSNPAAPNPVSGNGN